jgi:hypothetical protein
MAEFKKYHAPESAIDINKNQIHDEKDDLSLTPDSMNLLLMWSDNS